MTVVLTTSAILFGILAYHQLPVNDLPAVDYPVIQVSCGYPGASPDTVAATIATPLERQFMQIDPLLEGEQLLLQLPALRQQLAQLLIEALKNHHAGVGLLKQLGRGRGLAGLTWGAVAVRGEFANGYFSGHGPTPGQTQPSTGRPRARGPTA